jgi:hypothetical protein
MMLDPPSPTWKPNNRQIELPLRIGLPRCEPSIVSFTT